MSATSDPNFRNLGTESSAQTQSQAKVYTSPQEYSGEPSGGGSGRLLVMLDGTTLPLEMEETVAEEGEMTTASLAMSADLSPEFSTVHTQESLYKFLLDRVKKQPPEDVLQLFKGLFFQLVDSGNTAALQAIYGIIINNNEVEFRNTLKRCCYILINNWDAARQHASTQALIQAFQDQPLDKTSSSPIVQRLRLWIQQFKESQDYGELALFATRYEEKFKGHWPGRYTSYLLVPQYANIENSLEQREAARALSKKLKDRFKFDLAMYVAKSQSTTFSDFSEKGPTNPTRLGDNVISLIKTIVAKRGRFSYANLAQLFLQQTQHLTYQDFKMSLKKYLILSMEKDLPSPALKIKLEHKLEFLYSGYHNFSISDALILRTGNRLIEFLTTEDRNTPSPLFILLVSHGNPMTLVIVLLKIILISPNSRIHLEAHIADLIHHYETYSEEDCWWVVNFLEIFNIIFAIHGENVDYNLVKMKQDRSQHPDLPLRLEDYRVFSQVKRRPRSKPAVDEP